MLELKTKLEFIEIDVQHDRYGWWYDIIYYPLTANIGKTQQGVIKASKEKLSIKP